MNLLLLLFIGFGFQQSGDTTSTDTTRLLQEIEVKAYAHRKALAVIPAAITVLNAQQMERFSNVNFLPAVNMTPGVRMEERSPGSYRLSIRGSSLRSPFGIRNVKMYWNGLPLTDPGGNTYFNLLDFSSIDRMEIMRGPGASQYGAGTGGVVLLESLLSKEKTRDDITVGSYGLIRTAAKFRSGNEQKYVQVRASHQQSNGYREQSALKRTFLQFESRYPLSASTTLRFSGFASDLFYETPGGLTLEQFLADPTQARPAGGPNAGAVEQKASIRNQTIFGGIQLEHDWGNNWITEVSLGGNSTQFKNPAIRNYEERNEKSFSLRMVTSQGYAGGRFSIGTEWQTGFGNIEVSQNLSGVKGNLTNKIKNPLRTGLVFVQNDLDLPKNFFLTTGVSLNQYKTSFEQRVPEVLNETALSQWIVVPRAGLSKKISSHFTAYTQIGKGFSPPTTAEFFPSTAVFNPDLKPESGYSSEAGVRGNFSFFNFSVNVFRLRLSNGIVVRRDEAGADYFINAGSILQRGLETSMRFNVRDFSFWVSPSLNEFAFEKYQQGSSDLSGNQLTGTPKVFGAGGIDYSPAAGFNFQFTTTYSGALPLDDRNTVYAGEYWVFGLRLGYKTNLKALPIEFMAGGENLTDRRYSLGNDLNAAGGRFFNAAPGRTFYGGVIARFGY